MLPSLRRGILTLCSRRIYIFMMVIVPLGCTFFFLNLMHEGLPLKVPVAMVDMDHSTLSRRIGRSLNASELIDITTDCESFNAAIRQVRGGEIFGFFYIPTDFQEKALSGRTPTLSFYSNMTIFVPGTLTFKGFKTIAVTTSGGIVQTTLTGAGIDESTAGKLIMPLRTDIHPIGNPWTNYSIYLSQSFLSGMLALLVMLITSFSICKEFKDGTSPQWLATAGGSMFKALLGKLLPQSVVFIAIGIAMQTVMFRFLHFPLNCSPWHMILAMILLVLACQAFATVVVEILPNLRFAMSICSLAGILCFSVAGFSFPVEKMYGAVGIFSYIMPIRYYFLIYIDQALNGLPLYYSRFYYIALLAMLITPALGLRRLRGRCMHPVYVP